MTVARDDVIALFAFERLEMEIVALPEHVTVEPARATSGQARSSEVAIRHRCKGMRRLGRPHPLQSSDVRKSAFSGS